MHLLLFQAKFPKALREKQSREVYNTLQSQKQSTLPPSINILEDSRKMERGRGRELGEEKGVINKSLISSVSSPPTSFPYHSETRSAQTYPPQAACRSGLIILTAIGRRLICCSSSPVCQNGDSSHQVPGQSQSGRTGSHTTNMLQLISLMPGAKTAHKS